MDDKRFRSDRGRDSIAELARLIAHNESVPSDNRFREQTVSDEASEFPPAPQLTVGPIEHEQGCERDGPCAMAFKRMTSMIDPTPPRRSIGIVKSHFTQRRSIRILKFRACAGTA